MKNQNRRYERTLVSLFFLAWGFVFLDRLVISFLFPIIVPEMNLTNAQVGQIGFVTTAAFALSAVVFGGLSDKSGLRKRWLVPLVFATALFTALCAFTQTFTQLMILRALVGVCEGPILPIMMSMLAQVSSQNKFGRNSGIVNGGVAIIGIFLGPMIVTQIASLTNWQMSFLLVSLPTFILAFALVKFTKEVEISPVDQAQHEKMKAGGFVEALKYRNIVICCLIAIVNMAGYWTLLLFAPLYWVNVGNISVQNMGFMTSAMGLLGIVYAILVPKLSDNFGRKPITIIFYIFCILPPLAMYFFPGALPSFVIYLLFAGVAGGLGPIFMTLIPLETVPERLKATSTGLIIGLGEVLGGAVFPIFAGSIADTKGLPFMMLVAAGAFFLAFLFSFILKESHPGKVLLPSVDRKF